MPIYGSEHYSFIVYKTTNTVNGNIYVGVHRQSHYRGAWYLGSGLALKNAIEKHGRGAFIRETLFEYDGYLKSERGKESGQHKAFLKEAELVNAEFIARIDTYNITLGGSGKVAQFGKLNPFYGKKHTDETKQRLSTSKIGKQSGIDNPFHGKTHDQNTRKILSDKLSGNIFITNGIEEHRVSKDTEIPIGWWRGQKPRSRHPMSDSQKYKMRESALQRKKLLCSHCNKEFDPGNYTLHIKLHSPACSSN